MAEAKKAEVTKDMTIGEVLEKHPEAAEVMMKNGLHCVGCHVAAWETLEQGASGHGIEVDKLVEEINKNIGKKSGDDKNENSCNRENQSRC